MVRFPGLSKEIWAKGIYIEKNKVIAKVYMRDAEITINNSEQMYDGDR